MIGKIIVLPMRKKPLETTANRSNKNKLIFITPMCDGIHGYMDTITSYRHSAVLHHTLFLFFVLFSLSVTIYSHVCVLFHQSIDSRASLPVTQWYYQNHAKSLFSLFFPVRPVYKT
jgi:hypothetical protein